MLSAFDFTTHHHKEEDAEWIKNITKERAKCG